MRKSCRPGGTKVLSSDADKVIYRENEMLELAAKNETEARAECVKLSQEHPERYITPFTCFGLFVSIDKRLHVFAPTDAVFDWYVLNGRVKPFTSKQKIADTLATPLLS